MGESVGTIYLDLVLKNTIKKQISDIAAAAQQQAQRSFEAVGEAAGDAVQRTFGTRYNKTLEKAKARVKGLEEESEALGAKMDSMLEASKGMFVGVKDPLAAALQYLENNKAFQAVAAQQETLTKKLKQAQETLRIEIENDAAKMAAAQERAQERAAAAAERAAQRQQAVAERVAATQKREQEKAAAASQQAQEKAAQESGAKQEAAALLAATGWGRAALVAGVAGKKILSGLAGAAKGIVSKVGSACKMAMKGIAKVGKAALSAMGKLVRSAKSLAMGAKKSAGGVQSLGTRLRSIVGGALIFNGISAALRNMTQYFKTAVMSSGQMRTAMSNLKGAAATAAAPFVQLLTPALTALANTAATVVSYVSKLISLLTGKSVSSMSASAKATDQYAKSVSGATQKAKELAKANNTLGIDELNVVQPQQEQEDGAAGAAGAVEPNFGFEGKSPFLDSVLESIKSGDYFKVGQLFAEKINESLGAINWEQIQGTVKQWATNLFTTLNGFIWNLDWPLLGATLGNGLNTVVTGLDTFFQGVNWNDLGQSLGSGLNGMFETVNWEDLGRLLTDRLKALLETFHGFLFTFNWGEFGSDLATMVMSAINNVDWVQAAGDLGTFALGILTGLQNIITGIDWPGLGKTFAECLINIDWVGIALNLVLVIGQALGGMGDFLISTFQELANHCGDGFFGGLLQFFADIFGWVKENLIDPLVNAVKNLLGIHSPSTVFAEIGGFLVQGLFGGLSAAWSAIVSFFDTKLKLIQNTFAKAWEALKTTTSNVWNGIKNVIRGVVNGIVGIINGMINAVEKAVNAVVSVLNGIGIDIPDWVPVFGGKRFGIDIPKAQLPRIPMLANGGVIGQPTLAMMGEYAGAASNPEIAAPESKLRDIFSQQLQPLIGEIRILVQAIMDGNQSGGVERPVELTVDGETLCRIMLRAEGKRGIGIGGAFASAY